MRIEPSAIKNWSIYVCMNRINVIGEKSSKIHAYIYRFPLCIACKSCYSKIIPLFKLNLIIDLVMWCVCEERCNGGGVLAFRNQFSLELDAVYCAQWSIEPGAQHLLALSTVLDAGLHRLVTCS